MIEENMNWKAKTYEEIRQVDLKPLIAKKGKFNYLSWSDAVDQLLILDPSATWRYEQPTFFHDQSMMVYCTVNAFGKSMTAQLPVLDSYNKAITEPNAMQVNTAMQRCLAKAIALHGLGLYIFQGEDFPEIDGQTFIDQLNGCQTMDELQAVFKEAYEHLLNQPQTLKTVTAVKDSLKVKLLAKAQAEAKPEPAKEITNAS